MNAVEIEEAVSRLAEAPFDASKFPFAFLEAFGNKETTIKRLQSGASNQSDVPGGVLQRNHIHITICAEGGVAAALKALRESPATAKQKCTFILATDGVNFEAENVVDGETVACAYADFSDHFGFFLPLAGITTVKQIRDNAFDINPFGEAYAILAKSMGEERLRLVAEVIAARRINLTIEEARELAKRALIFKREKGRLPSLTAADPWEKRMAEGIALLQRKAKEA